jgi:anti-sigma factor RsiW
MNCAGDWIEAYLDDELDATERAEAERHLAGCADCSAALARLREQSRRIRAEAPYYSAPAGLERSVRESLRGKARETPWRWMAIAASLVLVASLAWNVLQWRSRTAANSLAEMVLTAHLRSLLGEHLLDVPSTDQHTVKPWFAGRADVSPVVADFTAQGYALLGGRADYIDRQRAAVLVYRHGAHVIDLFAWAEVGRAPSAHATRAGYHLLSWRVGDVEYCAVSDAGWSELGELESLLLERASRETVR